MWKYQCKKHLSFILGGILFGAIFFGLFGYSQAAVADVAKQMNMPELLKNPYIPYISGAIVGAGAANGFLIVSYLMQRFNISFIFMYLIIMIGFVPMIMAGMVLVLPAIAVCIYGILTIPNRDKRNNLRRNAVSSVAEIERVYRLHHTYHEEYEDIAKKAWEYTLRMNLTYIIGLLMIFLLTIYFNDILMVFLLIIAYAIFFFQLNRRKVMAVEPIVSLLYEKSDPEACASAIFALARKSKKRKNFPLPQYLAQCMIYLNDPHLAADVLVTCERNKNAIMFPYYSLMAYAYYQLGDESMVQFQLDECTKSSARMVNGPMAMLRKQCLEGIENKLQMMNKDFSKANTYYSELLKASIYEFQKVDAHYYLGLMSFVERDIDDAQQHFRYVTNHGNKMYFVEKAENFLKMIEAAQTKYEYSEGQ